MTRLQVRWVLVMVLDVSILSVSSVKRFERGAIVERSVCCVSRRDAFVSSDSISYTGPRLIAPARDLIVPLSFLLSSPLYSRLIDCMSPCCAA